MAWVKIDDQFPDHPKARAVGAHGRGVFLEALCYSNRLLSDGFVPQDIASKLATEHAGRAHAKAVIDRLLAVGLWERADGGAGYQIHDYADYQPTAAKVKAQRKANAKRQAEWQARRLEPSTNTVSNAISNTVTNASLTTPRPVPVPVPLGASHEAPASETAADARQRIDRQVYALVDAFAEGKGLARSDLAGAARKTAFNALAESPTWVMADDVRACTAYLMTDLFWSQPGKLKAKVVVETLPEWRNKGRPSRTKLQGIAGGQSSDLNADDYKGGNHLKQHGR